MDEASTNPPDTDVIAIVERVLSDAVRRRASDVHIEPTATGGEVRFRVDGLLERVELCDAPRARAIVNRLMVLARLLTYRLDVPQEGRATVVLPVPESEISNLKSQIAPTLALPRSTGGGDPIRSIELRVSVMPTTHGLRCAVRLPAELIQPQRLEELGLSTGVLAGLKKFAGSDAGMLIVTGPAGSGKTTTIYAMLRHMAETSPGLSMIALEDPVERDIPGVTQIEVKPFGELTYERCLRSILRQDPQVLMLGEIRDAATATLAAQAALSGHRLICTLHAASPGGAIARLLEMGLEPYQITSSIFGVVAQRLLRRQAGEGYGGRVPVAEYVAMDAKLREGVLRRADADELNQLAARQPGYLPFRQAAQELVTAGVTDAMEVRRVFGES